MLHQRKLWPLLVGLAWLIGVSIRDEAAGQDRPPPACPASPEDLRSLIDRLGADQFRVRERASEELTAIGRRAEPALRQAVHCADAEIRMRAARILDAIHASLPYLIESLKDRNALVRAQAIAKLERLGPTAKEALPLLIELLQDDHEAVREAAASAVLTLDPDNVNAADVVPPQAHGHGKYTRLVRRLKAPEDYRTYSEYRDYGFYQACMWGGHINVPAGYWVYVQPYWYIWSERQEPKNE
ncbi:MAG: HEAT repeat domain-containing protein [Planctomycetia bacterium]|nr:HEAT repeat domain-containing protein [Planctomycetia bacterium]